MHKHLKARQVSREGGREGKSYYQITPGTPSHYAHPTPPADLLNITAAPHNGSVGALYHFLTPEMVSSLPPPQSFGGLVGITDTCTFPKDRAALVEASLCDECVCRDVCNVEDDIILANNAESFNLTSLEGESFSVSAATRSGSPLTVSVAT